MGYFSHKRGGNTYSFMVKMWRLKIIPFVRQNSKNLTLRGPKITKRHPLIGGAYVYYRDCENPLPPPPPSSGCVYANCMP